MTPADRIDVDTYTTQQPSNGFDSPATNFGQLQHISYKQLQLPRGGKKETMHTERGERLSNNTMSVDNISSRKQHTSANGTGIPDRLIQSVGKRNTSPSASVKELQRTQTKEKETGRNILKSGKLKIRRDPQQHKKSLWKVNSFHQNRSIQENNHGYDVESSSPNHPNRCDGTSPHQ